jgi:hypothetical protein
MIGVFSRTRQIPGMKASATSGTSLVPTGKSKESKCIRKLLENHWTKQTTAAQKLFAIP